ncbi:PREDICTED: beta-1,4-mannosyl-glycoprotein 4-beta-N-acetylglucosaminyltransferase-like [Priapulus caudatus]|uniref:Beta-1,4-mannosyl-glycoprotein 4-beta-N-acetylglucosaminyltransferase-like n=1 Tax=Priapulus caudatus TaxID=37621 RepID=A0ABM1EFA4_PRICU|nr:PREDICTED: beta-1,4-mannosyl-glycoprotein 4-beta-N-acetylglucosaminyltransferase-like [Priapulus caudatus]
MKIRKSPRRISHAINVNHEVDTSEVRFHELSDVVDVFIICESNYTAFGNAEEPNISFTAAKGFLKEFQHKIAYIFLDHFPREKKEDGWAADRYLRTFMGKKALTQIIGYRPDDLIVLADADEIPSSDVLWFLKMYDGYSEPIAFTLRWSYYGFFWKGPNDKHTQVISAATIAYVKYVCDSDLIKLRRPPKQLNSDAYRSAFNRSVLTWTIGPPQGPFAGWHCSWCFPPQGIQTKLISAQNGDFPRWGNFKAKQNLDYIKGLIRDGKYFDGSHPFNAIVTLKSDDFYAPSYVLSNPKRFSYLLHNPYRST